MGDIVGFVYLLVSAFPVRYFKHLLQELGGLSGVKWFADDVLIHGTSEADHDSSLEGFLSRCQQKGIKLNSMRLELKT